MLIVNVLARSRRFDKALPESRCNLSIGRELKNTKNKESLDTGGLERRRFPGVSLGVIFLACSALEDKHGNDERSSADSFGISDLS